MIFITAVIIEMAFAAFCIITKSNHVKERSVIGIVSFAVFMLLAILPIIDWSFRYFALALFLFLLAIIGASTLIQKKRDNSDFKAMRVVFRSIGKTVLIFVVTLPAIIFPQDREVIAATGDYHVLTQTYTYTDMNRVESYTETGEMRKLNVQFWYPDNMDAKYPMIVFSHGGLGIKASNESLFNELASHGYVVCSVDHSYQSFYTTDEDGDTIWIDLGYVQELFVEDPRTDMQQSYEYYQKWMKIRTDDLSFVIDYIIDEVENDNENIVYNLVDTEKIGVMGHSLGGSAVLGIGRMRDDVSAVIALESPFMYDIQGVEDDRFIFTDSIYPVPVLNVYSDSSWGLLADRAQYATNYDLLSDTDATAFDVNISGVGHLALTDLALTSPLITRSIDGEKITTEKAVYSLKTINKVCLEFFNSYLKENGEFNLSGSY